MKRRTLTRDKDREIRETIFHGNSWPGLKAVRNIPVNEIIRSEHLTVKCRVKINANVTHSSFSLFCLPTFYITNIRTFVTFLRNESGSSINVSLPKRIRARGHKDQSSELYKERLSSRQGTMNRNDKFVEPAFNAKDSGQIEEQKRESNKLA